MFLGVKSSTVSFTSEEATKFRAARDESRSRNASKRDESRNRNVNRQEDNRSRSAVKRDESMTSIKDTSRGRDQNKSRREIMNNFFHKMEENSKVETKEGNPEKRLKHGGKNTEMQEARKQAGQIFTLKRTLKVIQDSSRKKPREEFSHLQTRSSNPYT